MNQRMREEENKSDRNEEPRAQTEPENIQNELKIEPSYVDFEEDQEMEELNQEQVRLKSYSEFQCQTTPPITVDNGAQSDMKFVRN